MRGMWKQNQHEFSTEGKFGLSWGKKENVKLDRCSVCQKRRMEKREFWELKAPFPAVVQWEAPFLSTFLLLSLAKSDEGKEMGVHAGLKGAPPPGSLHANIPWFLECFGFETCSPMCWNLPAAFVQ
ncbi:unnamed protein product [Prunus armeniaca]